MNHKEYLPCGSPDLARSAQSWLNQNNFEDVDLSHLSEPEAKRDFPGLSQGWSCDRKRAYQALDYDRADFEWSSKVKFEQGNFIEAYWLNALANVWEIADHILEGQREVSIELEGEEITGHPDGILNDRGQRYILEVKSMSQATFDARWNDTSVVKMISDDGVLSFDPNDEEHWRWWGNYVSQTHGYCKATGYEDILYLFIGRDYGVECAYQEYDPRVWSRVEDRWRTVMRAYQHGSLPARPEKVRELREEKSVWKGGDSYPCGYCAYYRECHEDLGPKREVDPVTGKSHLVMNGGTQ